MQFEMYVLPLPVMVRLLIFRPDTRAAADRVSVPLIWVFAPVSSVVAIVTLAELTVGLSVYVPGCTSTVFRPALTKVNALTIVRTGLISVPSPVVSFPSLLTWISSEKTE